MITVTYLQTSLLDLLHEIKGTDIKPILGGGFGLDLEINHVQQQGARTLLREWPEPRSTNDLDLFLRPALLINPAELSPLAAAISGLGYKVVPGAEKYQFVKSGPEGSEAGSVKIDILTGPRTCFKDTKVKVDARRARPKPSVGIHAHPVDEAPSLEESLLSVQLAGKLGSGDSWQADVLVPHPYTFSMMKLFAFRDRIDDANKDFGRYHALDLYAVIATTIEEEWRHANVLKDQYGNQPYVLDAGRIVSEHFSSLDRLGMVRLRESPYYRPEFQLEEFISTLQELFPVTAETGALKGA